MMMESSINSATILPPYEEEFETVDNLHWSPETANNIYLFWIHQLQASTWGTSSNLPMNLRKIEDVNIAKYTKDNWESLRPEWEPYAKRDTLCLGACLIKYNQAMKKTVFQNVSNNLTAPSLSLKEKVNPCKNGGTEQPSGRCDCTDEYTGPTCEEKVNPCKNGGTEQPSGRCDCTDEYTGPTCEDSLAIWHMSKVPLSTTSGSSFISSRIKTKISRVIQEKVNPCKNGGTESPSGRCDCTDKYTGPTCEEKVNPCKNGGTESPSGRCDCTDKYTGPTCEEKVNPCKNGGTESPSGRCDCTDKYTGPTCEEKVNPCKNGGTESPSGRCDCTDKYTGPTCEEKVNPCKNGGTEQPSGRCDCTDKYTGPTCEEKVNPCKNGGTEQPSGRCDCTDEYTGPTCEEKANLCKNGGTEQPDGTCRCRYKYTGPTCENKLPPMMKLTWVKDEKDGMYRVITTYE
ncbi:hypothetical protein LOTGIDRAFT_175791 [Lottia gigantea]|uniref:EGF-like domain-containing protein n=1 Tax=Lottia gigantea TaxID=225164 RepID=V4ACB6_LOTGI|nr:hypothetical protein LOTGIDRAFT_175791 [Lottia gigantea]ESO90931.1 hypothetical protein LOTGIDRAFT_175791 [Lottia gigantea]